MIDKHTFDSFLNEPDISNWAEMTPNFPDTMWKLGFEMDCYESYKKLFPSPLSYRVPEIERVKIVLGNLFTLDKQIYGNYVFSYWRDLTHWYDGGYDREAVAFFFHKALPALIEKINVSFSMPQIN